MLMPLKIINITKRNLINNKNVFKTPQFVPLYAKFYSTKTKENNDTITIGDVTKNIKLATNPELVPQKYGKMNIFTVARRII